jgi:hypothetical protein
MRDTRNVSVPKKKKKAYVEFAFKPYELQQEIIDYLDGKFLKE